MSDLPLMDIITGTVIFAALIRGLFIGLVREGLSLAAIGICTIVTRLFVDPLTIQLTELTNGEITGRTAVWIAGVLLVMATILACGVAAKLMKLGVQFAGLGWADRAGGGALGLAEGSIIAAVLVLIALWLVGPDHPATEGALSVEIVEEWSSAQGSSLEDLEGRVPSVTSPSKWFRD